jgi:hypothetical protein
MVEANGKKMAKQKRDIVNRGIADGAAGPRQPGPVSRVGGAARRVRLSATCLLLCLVAASAMSAQGNTAVITGADHVFIRRGPGTEFPPFANLSQGATVEIQEMLGEWARVQTVSGQSGYIRSTFLSLLGDRSPAATTPMRAAVYTATPAERQMPGGATSSAQTKTPSPDLQPSPEEVPAAKGHIDTLPNATPAAPLAPGEIEKLHGDVARLTATVEQLQRRLDVDAPKDSVPPLQTAAAEGGSRVLMSTAILLTAIGLCVGWLLGNAYGRRQERGRRPRVRL